MSIKYPIVPFAPGIPPVLRKQGPLITAGVLLVKDAVRALLGAPAIWGIYKDGKSVITVDSVVALDFRKEWFLANFPIEDGAFSTYNKVKMPYDVRLTMARGGTEAERTQFLATLDAVCDSLTLYDVVTPEYTYTKMNVSRLDYRRTATQGATLLTVTIGLQEIRSTAKTQFSSVDLTALPSGAQQIATGVVQALPAPPNVPKPLIDAATNLPESLKDLQLPPGFSPGVITGDPLGPIKVWQ